MIVDVALTTLGVAGGLLAGASLGPMGYRAFWRRYGYCPTCDRLRVED